MAARPVPGRGLVDLAAWLEAWRQRPGTRTGPITVVEATLVTGGVLVDRLRTATLGQCGVLLLHAIESAAGGGTPLLVELPCGS